MTAEPSSTPSSGAGDEWSEWVLDRRDGGDRDQRQYASEFLEGIRDRVLSGAEPLAGASLLDVGTGDGLIALAALDRVGTGGQVTFSDVSPALLDEAGKHVQASGLNDRASFVVAAAEDLHPIASGTIDVVTARSVLIYVDDKARALAEMHRVLRPGGRISLAEPINRLMFPEPDDRFWSYDITEIRELADRVKAEYKRADRAAPTMHDFDERDLADMAAHAGFAQVRLALHSEISTGDSLMRATCFETLLSMAPNPLAPRLAEIVEASLSAREARRFIEHLRSAHANRACVRRWAMAFLVAAKSPNGHAA